MGSIFPLRLRENTCTSPAGEAGIRARKRHSNTTFWTLGDDPTHDTKSTRIVGEPESIKQSRRSDAEDDIHPAYPLCDLFDLPKSGLRRIAGRSVQAHLSL